MFGFINKIKKGRFYAVLFLIVSIFVFVDAFIESSAQNAPREHLLALTDFDLEKRQYLDCGVDFVLANYAETTEEESTFGVTTNVRDYSQSYIIPCWVEGSDDFRFISVEVTYYPFIQEFNKIYDLTYSENEEDFQSYYFEFTGRVEKMDSEMTEFAFQALLESGAVLNRAEFNEIFLPYEIRAVAPNAYNTTTLFIIGGILFIVAAVIFFIDYMGTRRQAALIAAAQFNSDSYTGDNYNGENHNEGGE
jgi:hypothetical protein